MKIVFIVRLITDCCSLIAVELTATRTGETGTQDGAMRQPTPPSWLRSPAALISTATTTPALRTKTSSRQAYAFSANYKIFVLVISY